MSGWEQLTGAELAALGPPRGPRSLVTFRQRGRSKRIWQAVFDLGSDWENGMQALQLAHARNAEILWSRPT